MKGKLKNNNNKKTFSKRLNSHFAPNEKEKKKEQQ